MFEPYCSCPGNQSSEIFHLIEYIFYHSAFMRNFALVLKSGVCPEFTVLNTYFLSFKIFQHLRLLWKSELFWNFSLYWIHNFYHSRFLSNLRFLWKTDLFWNFSLYSNMFYHSGFLSNLRLPWQHSLPWYFLLYWIYFYHSECLSNFALPWKSECVLKLFTVLNIILSFRILSN